MTAASIITFIIFFIVAMIMIGLGIFQLKSTSPVGFYSGEKPPREEELTDVKAWNKKHGMMWLIYGIIIMISYFVGYLIGDSVIDLFRKGQEVTFVKGTKFQTKLTQPIDIPVN